MGIFIALKGVLKDSKIAKALQGFDTITPRTAIVVDDAGLSVALDPSNLDLVTPTLPWSEIKRVVAFKRDLLAVDLICLRFEASQEKAYEVNEEMGGWDELLGVLPTCLPGCLSREEFLGLVVQPAFAQNDNVIYERQ